MAGVDHVALSRVKLGTVYKTKQGKDRTIAQRFLRWGIRTSTDLDGVSPVQGPRHFQFRTWLRLGSAGQRTFFTVAIPALIAIFLAR